MDPLSLSSLGAVGLGYAVKLLFDRANSALDRRAQRRAVASEAADGSAGDVTNSALASTLDHDLDAYNAADRDMVDKDTAENEVIGAMRVLEVYRAKNLALEPGDTALLETVQRLHAALERLEGVPLDLNAAASSLIEVGQSADHVRGELTGADLGVSPATTTTHVRQEVGTVHEGGSVTGFRAGGGR